jgi:thymidylate kinase
MAKQEPGRWVVVDAGKEWEKVQKQLRRIILKKQAESEIRLTPQTLR